MSTFPPPPLNDASSRFSRPWHLWYDRLSKFLSDTAGLIPWASISKSGSNLTEIATRNHNDLQNVQGGTTGERYHATAAEYAELQRADNVASSAVNIALDDTRRTVLMTATGKTVTLPAASTARIGKDWTVILGVEGYTDITRAGSDTLTLPTNDTTIRLDNKGASVTLRCLTASSWGIA